MTPNSDPLERLLQPPQAVAADDLRRRLRAQTSQQVGDHRGWRSLILGAGLAACFAALVVFGIVMWLATPFPPAKPRMAKVPEPPAPELIAVEESVSPLDMEWRAFDSQEEDRAANYFAAGNKYFEANDDLASALRCYSQALDACSPEQLEIAPDDNWLVASLKTARLKEKEHD